jgi:cytochrome c biogenesis protein
MSKAWAQINKSTRRAATRLWHLLTSVKLALSLILAIAVVGLIGIVLDQVPGHLAGQVGGKDRWLETVARPEYGMWTDVLDSLGLFRIFRSPWFLVPVAVLAVSILACSVNRWKPIRKAISGGPIRHSPEFYVDGGSCRQVSSSRTVVPDLARGVQDALRRRGYRVPSESSPEGLHMAADKNRFFLIGTYLGHLSLVLLILGFILSSRFGFRNVTLVVPEGGVRDVGLGTGLAVSVRSFTAEYWPGGEPKDYRSEVTLYRDGTEVKQGTIRVNHPMSYNGVRFYQSFYGPAVSIMVQSPEGAVLYDDVVALSDVLDDPPLQRPFGSFRIPESGVTVYVVGPAIDGSDPSFNTGEIGLKLFSDDSSDTFLTGRLQVGTTGELEGLKFTYVEERQFSGLEVSKDPGNAIIWTGSGLLIVGLFAVLYFPHRQIWAIVCEDEPGGGRVCLRGGPTRRSGVAADLEAVTKEVKKRIATGDARRGEGRS